MRDTQNAPGIRIRGWVALLVVAGFAHASCAFAQIYKCTDADGRTAFSDKPCATPPGAAGSAATGKDGVKQETLRQPKPAAANTGADATSAMCAKYEGSKATDSMIQSLPEMQRKTVIAALRGVMAGMARDPGAQETLKRVTLHIDASRNAIICVPRQRAQSPGAPPATTFIAHRIEPNGRMETLQPGAQPLVYNDANEPQTVAARCASMITSCVRSKTPGHSLDECFEKQPVCPAGRLDPALSCCPQACKDAYRRERSKGTDAETATIKVIFGDDAGAASCVPGMPKRG
jgi:uncharacterized protein DUF4124